MCLNVTPEGGEPVPEKLGPPPYVCVPLTATSTGIGVTMKSLAAEV